MKKRAAAETVNNFLEVVYPEYTELAKSLLSEEAVLKEATRLIKILRASQSDSYVRYNDD